jgi:glycosyltransferase involved in cell wall biosynthesis
MKKTQIIFMPVSYDKGMAGNQRLKNLVEVLKEENILCKNIIIRKEFITEYEDPNITHIKYKASSILSLIRLPFSIYNVLKKNKLQSGKNIIYHTGYPNIQNRYIFFLAKFLSYKIIFDIVEDNYAISNYKSFYAKIRIKSSLYYFKKLYKISNGAIYINEHLQTLIKKKNKRIFPLYKIPISINPKEFDKNNVITPNKKIFYGGSFGHKDGLQYLLEAFDKIADSNEDCQLVITGKANQKNEAVFQKLLMKIKNKNKVILKGYLEREEYIKTLQSCFIHCVTRNKTDFAKGGFPFKLGEMLSTGNPVISTKVGEVENYLSNKVNALLIEAESTLDLYDAINFIINNTEKAIAIGEQGKKTAIQEFCLNNQKNKIVTFLQKI